MKKKLFMVLCACVTMLSVCVSACGNETEQEETTQTQQETSDAETAPESAEGTEGSGVLVAYFTRLPNTESGDDLDAVVQGGGPYGSIGESYATADMDAITSASVTVLGDEVKGNVEAVADWIAETTGGDLFSIETTEKYPVNYDAVIEEGGIEQRDNARPELSTHIENLNQYSVIYLGYPNWYNDMPMALYSFLDEYDFQGKTIIPFCTSAGSGLANTINEIKEMEPGATVVDNGLALHMNDIKNAQAEVTNWVQSVNPAPAATEETTEMTAGTYPDGSSPEFSDTRIRLNVDGQEVVIRMYDNTAAEAFLERLPLEELEFYDLSGIEKPARVLDEEFSLGSETPGYDPVTGDMVIYRPWGNFTIFYGDFRHSDELVPLGQVESGLDIIAGQTEDFTGTMELVQ